MRIVLVALSLLCFQKSFAGRPDSTIYRLGLANTGILNNTRESKSYTISNTIKFAIKGRRTELDAIGNYVYGQTDEELVNNDVSATLTGNRYVFLDPRFYIWALGSYESSFSLGVASRSQTGIGAAWSLVDSPHVFINFSEGVLVENSNIRQSDSSTVTSQTLRNSFRFRFRFSTPNDGVVFEGINSIQNSFKDFGDLLLRLNNTLTIKVWKGVGLTAAVAYNNITATNRENLLLTLGLKVDYLF